MLKKKKILIKIIERGLIIIAVVIITSFVVKAVDNSLSGKRGGIDKDGDGCTDDMVFVSYHGGGFCIDKYEASVGDECPYKNPENQSETRLNLDYIDCSPKSVSGLIPWRNISRDQAARACAKAGKHLPDSEEWLQAALGTVDSLDSWGIDDCQVSANWPKQPGATGTGKNCVSSFGALDMIGNVWEWVEGTVVEGVFAGRALPGNGYVEENGSKGLPSKTGVRANPDYNEDYFWLKNKGSRGIVRGGYWNNKSDAGVYSAYIVAPPSGAEAGIGFRCAR